MNNPQTIIPKTHTNGQATKADLKARIPQDNDPFDLAGESDGPSLDEAEWARSEFAPAAPAGPAAPVATAAHPVTTTATHPVTTTAAQPATAKKATWTAGFVELPAGLSKSQLKIWLLDNTSKFSSLDDDELMRAAIEINGLSVLPQSWLDTAFIAAVKKARPQKTIDQAKNHMDPWAYVGILNDMGYTFKMNDLDDTIEVNATLISDATEARIRTDLRAAGHNQVNVARDAYVAHASDNRFNPITDYLNAQKWDGQDHIAKLGGYYTDSHKPITYANGEQRTVFHAFFRRWIIGAVDKVLNQGQNAMLVPGGPQGLGKSYLAVWLASEIPQFGHEGPIRPDDHQETYMLMTTTLCWEVGELGSTTRRQDVEAIKQIITQKKAKYKPPYGHNLIDKFVTSSFIGTVNDDGTGYLKDVTGNRRFMCVDLTAINRRYSTEVTVGQVWAQAVALCKAGETGTALACEVSIRDEINETHTMINPIEPYIEKYFTITQELTDALETVDMVGLLKEKEYKGSERQIQMEIAQVLKAKGCVKESRPSRWLGVKHT